MLIGASSNSIDLIKDLGTYPPIDVDETEFSKIEIPNIRIPKIEIPKIEFPNIGFTRASKKANSDKEKDKDSKENSDDFIISEIYEESSDGIIDKLFTPSQAEHETTNNLDQENEKQINKHTIDPDEYALYKKYL